MSGWVKTSHYATDTWPERDGPHWISVRQGRRSEILLAHWDSRRRVFKLDPSSLNIIPWGSITHYQRAVVPDPPEVS